MHVWHSRQRGVRFECQAHHATMAILKLPSSVARHTPDDCIALMNSRRREFYDCAHGRSSPARSTKALPILVRCGLLVSKVELGALDAEIQVLEIPKHGIAARLDGQGLYEPHQSRPQASNDLN